jgi:ubiquinone biosynthesis protein
LTALFLFHLKDEIKDAKRLKEIAGIFTKYGLGYLIQKFHLQRFSTRHASADAIFTEPLSVRVRMILEELGPTFIKLGQMLSLHPEIVPLEFCKEFEKLQDSVPPVDFAKIKAAIETEYKKPLEEIFKDFPATPIASASLAQVYKVKIGSKEAIIKVQKPNVQETIRADMDILGFLASHIDKHNKNAAVYDPLSLMEEFKRYINNELDFKKEILNTETIRHNFRHDKTVYIPAVYDELCTDKIIVVEYIKGTKLSNIDKLRDLGLDTRKIAHALVAFILKQIFTDGFFHGDPHPGNIFILSDGRVACVDFGVVGRIDDETKLSFAHMFIAAAERDADAMLKILHESMIMDYANEARLKLSLQHLLDDYYGISLKDFNMNNFLKDLTNALYENRVRIPSDNLLLIKSLGMLESEAKMLDPELDFGLEIQRAAQRIIKEEFSPLRIFKKVREAAQDVFSLVQSFPKDLFSILHEIKTGKLKIGFEHLNLEDLISVIDRSSNRLSFSLIIAALLIGSSFLIHSGAQTYLGASSRFGTTGFVIGAILGCWLLIHIIRSGKL